MSEAAGPGGSESDPGRADAATRVLPREWASERLMVADAAPGDVAGLAAVFGACAHVHARGWDPTFRPVPDEEIAALVRRSLDPAESFQLQAVRRRGEGEIIGYFHLSPDVPHPGTVWISILVLHPAEQGRRYGQEVVRGLLERARAAGVFRAVWLRVYLKNWPALRFWTGMGFTRIIQYDGDAAHGDDAVASLVLEHRL